jgi:hypothetical protein
MTVLLPAAVFGLGVAVSRPGLVSSPAFLEVVQPSGLSAVAAAWLGFVVPTVLAFIVAVVIRRARPDDPNALLFGLSMIALFLLVSGVGTAIAAEYSVALGRLVDVLCLDLTLLGLYLFPNGRFVPRWTRWPPILLILTSWAIPSLMAAARAAGTGTAADFPGWVTDLGVGLAFVALTTWLPGQVHRYRRHSNHLERLQTRWVLFGFGLLFGGSLGAVFRVVGLPAGLVTAGLLAAAAGSYVLPLATGFAVLRYRLYEIDRIISRTVTYALVGGLLTALYAGTVFGMTEILPASGDLAVAASTLAVAALFNPLRRRIQRIVDRRFNRSRYDAALTIDSFAARLRSRMHLGDLLTDLRGVLAQTLEPTSTAIWVRGSSTS